MASGSMFGGTGSIAAAIVNPTQSVNPTTATTGGTITAGTYYAKYTYTNATGETVPSNEGSVTTTGSTSTITFTSPAWPTGVTGCNVYIGTASGQETKQGSIASSGGTLTLTAPPTTNGGNLPYTNTTGGFADIKPGTAGVEWDVHNIYAHGSNPSVVQISVWDGTNLIPFDTLNAGDARINMGTHVSTSYWIRITPSGTSSVPCYFGYDGMETA